MSIFYLQLEMFSIQLLNRNVYMTVFDLFPLDYTLLMCVSENIEN